MKITKRLQAKADAEGRKQIYLSAYTKVDGKSFHLTAKSEVYTLPVFFDNDKGIDLSKKRIIAPDVRKYHTEQLEKLNGIITAISKAETEVGNDKSVMVGDWLKNVVDKHLHPENYLTKEQKEKNKTFYELAEDYLVKKQFSYDHTKGFRVLVRAVARYEYFIRETDKKRKDFSFNVHTVTRDDIEDFRDYLRAEKDLAEEYPKIFENILKNYPANIKAGYGLIEGRGENATIKLMKKLKAFFHWLVETERTKNRPFEGIKIGCEKYGTPFYITLEERNIIASTPMPTKHLEHQRDIFIFHCFVGCRVGDLVKLTASNIHDDVLTYAPHKTKDEGEQSKVAKIPLSDTAKSLIAKYNGVDKKGRLFPFISPQKYNDAIKEIFTLAGITRKVIVRNALTGENENRPINEVASSHLARRTFVGNAYKQVADPNIIGEMSGHVEGSRAFSRYRNIETETLKDVISKIDKPTATKGDTDKREKLLAAGFTEEQVNMIMAI
ncbi:recombinase [Palleniella muris]|uniref:Recombinase n=1 Tax=Palleniella muris TaxID=3038145 RepID=A0AC61QPY0_9BACT|nr:site-specific integrase [Palleniella muris]TGX82068.1 recombinase [Palleniella muris]